MRSYNGIWGLDQSSPQIEMMKKSKMEKNYIIPSETLIFVIDEGRFHENRLKSYKTKKFFKIPINMKKDGLYHNHVVFDISLHRLTLDDASKYPIWIVVKESDINSGLIVIA